MSVDSFKCPLSILERCPSHGEYSDSKRTEKRQGPTPGVRLREVSVSESIVTVKGLKKKEGTNTRCPS